MNSDGIISNKAGQYYFSLSGRCCRRNRALEEAEEFKQLCKDQLKEFRRLKGYYARSLHMKYLTKKS